MSIRNRNRIAVRKYFTEIGVRALPTDSIPHSNASPFTTLMRRGANKGEVIMAKATKATASPNCTMMGRKSCG